MAIKCDGHNIEIGINGITIDEKFYVWRDLCWFGEPSPGLFVAPEEDLSQRLTHILRYGSGHVLRLVNCQEVLDVVQKNVQNCS